VISRVSRRVSARQPNRTVGVPPNFVRGKSRPVGGSRFGGSRFGGFGIAVSESDRRAQSIRHATCAAILSARAAIVCEGFRPIAAGTIAPSTT